MSVKWYGPNLSIDDAPAPGAALALSALVDTIEEGGGALHVMMVGGYWDGVTPYFSADYVQTRVSPKYRSNITVYHDESGHTGRFTHEQLRRFYEQVLAAPLPKPTFSLLGME